MSIKINASFSEISEKAVILEKYKAEIRTGAKVKVVPGKPYSHIYITLKDGKTP